MAIHDIYETRIRTATERASEYLRLADRSLASFDMDTMGVTLPNGILSTVVADSVNLLEFQHETTLDDTERQDLAFVLGIMFGAALHKNGRLDAHLEEVSENLSHHIS